MQQNQKNKKNKNNMMIWIVVSCFIFLIAQSFFSFKKNVNTIPYSHFINESVNGNIASVNIKGLMIEGADAYGKKFTTYNPGDLKTIDRLLKTNVVINSEPLEDDSPFWNLLVLWMPLILFGAIWFFALRNMNGGSKVFHFGKSKAKLVEKSGNITFEDVAGIDEAKAELEEIVDFLKEPAKFIKLGGKIPKGVLLVGPPGTGKTLLARAIAGEADVPFFSISGSEFVEMFVGVGASRVRDMFDQGKQNAPCIIFIDEIDAVGAKRGSSFRNDEREQTLNQLLVEMDGFAENNGVIVIAATNRSDVLDKALLRPGRFDRQIPVPLPDIVGREKILQVHLKKVPAASDVNLSAIAKSTPGFAGADLANLVNEAALLAARHGKSDINQADLEDARDKVMIGTARLSMVMTDELKKMVAYHEAGHAIVSYYLIDSDPIHKATIIPRGDALGLVMRLPETDRMLLSKKKLEADIAVAAGGRIAETLIFGKEYITTGAASDIAHASIIARKMVLQCAMSDKLGFLSFSKDESGFANNFSDETFQLVDLEVKRIVDEAYAKAEQILNKYIDKLHLLANSLIEHETLTGDEITTILLGSKIEKSAHKTRNEFLSTIKANAKKVEQNLRDADAAAKDSNKKNRASNIKTKKFEQDNVERNDVNNVDEVDIESVDSHDCDDVETENIKNKSIENDIQKSDKIEKSNIKNDHNERLANVNNDNKINEQEIENSETRNKPIKTVTKSCVKKTEKCKKDKTDAETSDEGKADDVHEKDIKHEKKQKSKNIDE